LVHTPPSGQFLPLPTVDQAELRVRVQHAGDDAPQLLIGHGSAWRIDEPQCIHTLILKFLCGIIHPFCPFSSYYEYFLIATVRRGASRPIFLPLKKPLLSRTSSTLLPAANIASRVTSDSEAQLIASFMA
jgi:hypothetical protein